MDGKEKENAYFEGSEEETTYYGMLACTEYILKDKYAAARFPISSGKNITKWSAMILKGIQSPKESSKMGYFVLQKDHFVYMYELMLMPRYTEYGDYTITDAKNPSLQMRKMVVINTVDKFHTSYEVQNFHTTYFTSLSDRLTFTEFTRHCDDPDLPWDVKLNMSKANIIYKKNKRFFKFLEQIYYLDKRTFASRKMLSVNFNQYILSNQIHAKDKQSAGKKKEDENKLQV